MKKILIIKLWAIGEVALSTACIPKLKNKYNDSDIYFLVGEKSKDILENSPHIKEIISVDENMFLKPDLIRLLKLIMFLRNQRFDIIVVLHCHTLFSLFSLLLGAPVRVGLVRPGCRSFYTLQSVSSSNSRHKMLEYLSVLWRLNIDIDYRDTKIEIFPDKEDRYAVTKLMDENNLESKKFIILSPTGGSNPAAAKFSVNIKNKLWPISNYKKLCESIINKTDFKVVIVGSKNEEKRADYVTKDTGKERVINFTGKTNLRQLVLLAEQAAVTVTNDSGPMFILSSSGTPILVIFGPTDANLTKPLSENTIIMQDKLNCAPCYDSSVFPNIVKDCRKPVCMERITPERVFDKIREILNLKNSNDKIQSTK